MRNLEELRVFCSKVDYVVNDLHLDLGDPDLNCFLAEELDENNCIRPDIGITEIAGDPGSGKTQLCLKLCASALFRIDPLSGYKVLIIDTEGCVYKQRIVDFLHGCGATDTNEIESWIDQGGSVCVCMRQRHKDILNIGLKIVRVFGWEEFDLCVTGLSELLSIYPSINLIIIDSIAFPARLALHSASSKQRCHLLWAEELNSLCSFRRISVRCRFRSSMIF